MRQRVRHLVVVLGDQLDSASPAFDGFDPERDAVWMAEVDEESKHVWSSKPRIALFLSAMRHFRDAQRRLGRRVFYRELDAADSTGSLSGELIREVASLRPERIVMTEAGEWRIQEAMDAAARRAGVPLEVRVDRHFFETRESFARHARGRKQLRMEFFYRELRRKHRVLLDAEGGPEGGQWNFDPENRGAFSKDGPRGEGLPTPRLTPPDSITREVLSLVERRFAGHPGSLESFGWPVTPEDAREALHDFVEHRLARFGRYQDAMWMDEPWLFHSRLSAAMNLKLMDPREVIGAAERAYREGRVPLACAEGFIRQILGWREYIRGVYWLRMPHYAETNALGATSALPAFYWTGDCAMNCLRQSIRQTLDHGYAHHIQRLMVTGLYALLLGVEPRQVHAWYLAVYVDAVEWVELPNTLGMSQYADGGYLASKPYAASGSYIQRMSNYCEGCRFRPGKSVGEDACPFTTLYWDFLLRHEARLRTNPRMALPLKNLSRLSLADRSAIRARAVEIGANGGVPRGKGLLPGF
ncbi:MAG: cryptochrome/photolyase family protein [Verrucomicrobiales bacterium]|nr:cryptochrome/photolyase family protein [Verrucomicrobiales bacterium]